MDPRQEHQRLVGLNLIGRAAVIMKQCDDSDVNIVGLQETRTSQGSRSTAAYHVFASGCTAAGTHGVAAWIKRVWLIETDSKVVDSFQIGVEQVVSAHVGHHA